MLRSSGKGVRVKGSGTRGIYGICVRHGGSDVCVYGRREANISCLQSGHWLLRGEPPTCRLCAHLYI